MSIYGQIIDGSQVEDIVTNFLKRWLPQYVAQVADDRGLERDAIPAPKTWANTTEFNLDETTQLPAILIITNGLAERPQRFGDGSFNAKYVIGIAVVVSAGGDDPARATSRLAKRYAAALHTLMLQQSALESDLVAGVSWDDESYDDVPSEQGRSLASVRAVFTIEIRNVLNANDGPILPDDPPDPTDPPGTWQTVRDPDSEPPYTPVTVERSH